MSTPLRELKDKGQAFLAKGKHRKALAVFKRAVDLYPDDVFAGKKAAEVASALGENESAAEYYVRLSALLDKNGRRLQAISCCKLALEASPGHPAAQSSLEDLYRDDHATRGTYQLVQETLARGQVRPPHPGPGADVPPAVPTKQPEASRLDPPPSGATAPPPVAIGLQVAEAAIPPDVASRVEVFVRVFVGLCASFSGADLSVQEQSLTDSISGNTDFMWLIQFTGTAEHTIVVSAQRRFILGLTQRVLDVDDALVSDATAARVSNKLIGMYVDDVKRALAAAGQMFRSGMPLPIAGANATYQLHGTRTLHVPMSSDLGWAQISIAGGL